MTRRITISWPDDVAEYAEQADTNTSGFIASVLRRKMRADGLRSQWAATGYVVTDDDVERVRAQVGALAPISEDKHLRNLQWLASFDTDNASAA